MVSTCASLSLCFSYTLSQYISLSLSFALRLKTELDADASRAVHCVNQQHCGGATASASKDDDDDDSEQPTRRTSSVEPLASISKVREGLKTRNSHGFRVQTYKKKSIK